jgi:hypothetical protein
LLRSNHLAATSTAILAAVAKRDARKTIEREAGTPWLLAVGQGFAALREAGGFDQSDLPTTDSSVSRFERGNGLGLKLLEQWCRRIDAEPDDVFLLAFLARRGALSSPVTATVQSALAHLKELADMLRDPEKTRILGYLADMNHDETIEMVRKAHEIWSRRHPSVRRAVHGP